MRKSFFQWKTLKRHDELVGIILHSTLCKLTSRVVEHHRGEESYRLRVQWLWCVHYHHDKCGSHAQRFCGSARLEEASSLLEKVSKQLMAPANLPRNRLMELFRFAEFLSPREKALRAE